MKKDHFRLFIAINKINNNKVEKFANYDEFLKQNFYKQLICYDEDGFPCYEGPRIKIDPEDISTWAEAMLMRWVEGSPAEYYLNDIEILPQCGYLEDIYNKYCK